MGSDVEQGETKAKRSGLIFWVLLVAGIAGGLGAMQILGSKDKAPPEIPKPLEPTRPPTGAYAEGGRPDSAGPGRVVFQEALPNFVIALSRWSHNRLPAEQEEDDYVVEARAAVVGAAREAAFPPELMERLEELLELSTELIRAKEERVDELNERFLQLTLKLNDTLASAGLGFFVDGTVILNGDGTRDVFLFSFEILRVVLYRSQGHDIRTLRVRRLDTINRELPVFGFTSSMRRDAVVLDHQIDDRVIELLPAMAEDMDVDPFALSDEDKQELWFTPFRKRASEIIRDELGAASNAAELGELGRLLARRIEIFEHWNQQLSGSGASLVIPKTLELEWNYRVQMQGLATHGEMDELDAIQKALVSTEMRQAFVDVHDHFARSVERHETQHRLDLANLYTLPMPDELADYVGELPDGYRGQDSRAASTLAELSAYLSELARDELTPLLNLALLSGFILNEGMWGSNECYAALAIFEGLTHELGIQHSDFVVRRRIDRDEVARIFHDLSHVPKGRMREAAANTWKRFFAIDLPTLELIAR